MLNKIKLKAFKSFADAEIKLAPLTVLTGLNSSGKSSVIQSIRMLYQYLENGNPYIEGHGTFDDFKSKLSLSSLIKCEYDFGEKGGTHLLLEKESHSFGEGIAKDDFPNMEYIGADRLGPHSILPNPIGIKDYISVGDKGQFCVDYYKKIEACRFNTVFGESETKSKLISENISSIVKKIVADSTFSFQSLLGQDSSYIEIDGFRAANTGFGLSYSLPIILAVLGLTSTSSTRTDDENKNYVMQWLVYNKKVAPILMIENPEAHLHPKGQTEMGKFLAIASKAGVQVIVETHSDHVLDGIRLKVKSKDISPSNLSLYHFVSEQDRGKEHKGSKIEKIQVDENGRIQSWPSGFFDQGLINLRELNS